MNNEIIFNTIQSRVYFESKYMHLCDFDTDLKHIINKAKSNDVYITYTIEDSASSWIFDTYYQYQVYFKIDIMPFINLPDYYQNCINPNYQFSTINFNHFFKYFVILLFTTENYLPVYFEDTIWNNENFKIDYLYIFSEKLAKHDKRYIYNKFMSFEVINQLEQWYHLNNNIYEPKIQKLIDKYSISLYDYIHKKDTSIIQADRKLLIL